MHHFAALEQARETMRRLFKHRSKRTLADERLYHGACLEDEYVNPKTGVALAEPPALTAKTPGPLPGRGFQGAWGTMGSRKCSSTIRTKGSSSSGGGGGGNCGTGPVSVVGFGVATRDGRKRDSRGGASEDAFSAVVDLLNEDVGLYDTPGTAWRGGLPLPQQQMDSAPALDAACASDRAEDAQASSSAPIGGANSGSDRGATFSVGHDRVFHLFAAYDGHRSNHAARYCAEAVGKFVAVRLMQEGVLRPLPNRAHVNAADEPKSASEEEDLQSDQDQGEREKRAKTEDSDADTSEEAAEEEAVREAFASAISTLDNIFCARRWVSLVRDNGKKFYVTRALEVEPQFDIDAWDAYPLEVQFRDALSRAAEEHGRNAGIPDGPELKHYVEAHHERWRCYKKELCPGAALCAVLVDEARGKVYCANVGDSGALLYHARAPGSANTADSATTAKDSADGVGTPDSTATASPSNQAPDNGNISGGGGGGGGGGAATGKGEDSGDRGDELMKNWGGFKAWTAPPDPDHVLHPGGIKLLCRAHKPSQPGELQRVCNTPEGFVLVHGIHVTMENREEVARHVAEAQALGQKVRQLVCPQFFFLDTLVWREAEKFIDAAGCFFQFPPDDRGCFFTLCCFQALYRINRDISLSRAIGDRDLKRFGVIGTPEVTVHRYRRGLEEPGLICLVVATDGVWDVLSPEACARMLQEAVDACASKEGEGDEEMEIACSVPEQYASAAQSAVERVVDSARGVVKNNDDVTAVVVTLWNQP